MRRRNPQDELQVKQVQFSCKELKIIDSLKLCLLRLPLVFCPLQIFNINTVLNKIPFPSMIQNKQTNKQTEYRKESLKVKGRAVPYFFHACLSSVENDLDFMVIEYG